MKLKWRNWNKSVCQRNNGRNRGWTRVVPELHLHCIQGLMRWQSEFIVLQRYAPQQDMDWVTWICEWIHSLNNNCYLFDSLNSSKLSWITFWLLKLVEFKWSKLPSRASRLIYMQVMHQLYFYTVPMYTVCMHVHWQCLSDHMYYVCMYVHRVMIHIWSSSL